MAGSKPEDTTKISKEDIAKGLPVPGIDGKPRCLWCGKDPLYVRYHDEEWGAALHDESKHFEFLMLETMQAGLSWITILRKREAYREAFAGFDAQQVAAFDDIKIEELMLNPGIIRNRAKIKAAVTNARQFLKVVQEKGSFDSYIWEFVDGKPIVNRLKHQYEGAATTELSDRVSADLKKRGFAFVGSTTMYAHLQAIGVVNDHLVDCFRYQECKIKAGAV